MNKTADSFAEVFNSKHVLAERQIEPHVVLNGNPSQLERLVSVLVENASKYAAENGKVLHNKPNSVPDNARNLLCDYNPLTDKAEHRTRNSQYNV